MRFWFVRIMLALWFIGIVTLAAINGRGAEAQRNGAQTLFLPVMEKHDPALHDYVALLYIENPGYSRTFYTVRGDNSELDLLIESDYATAIWSGDGNVVAFVESAPDQDESVVIVPFTSRVPRELFSGVLYGSPLWSPDSRYLAFFTGAPQAHLLQIYDARQDELHAIPLEPDSLYFHVEWSPDSQSLAWVQWSGAIDPKKVWVWRGIGTSPQPVFAGDTYYLGMNWSPDSSRLAFSADSPDGVNVYVANRSGTPATMLLQGFSERGWVDGGARLLVVENSSRSYYLASADGQTVSLFREWNSNHNMTRVSPSGNHVLFANDYDGSRSAMIQATGQLTATYVSRCRGTSIDWREDGNRFACDSNRTSSGTWATLGDTSYDPPQLLPLQNHKNPRYVAASADYLSIEQTSPGYPANSLGTILFNPETGMYKRLRISLDRYYVVDWRYRP